MSRKDWVKIFETNQLHKAEIIKSLLIENEIECVSLNKKDSAYGIFGDIELYTLRVDVIKALHLINHNNL